MKKLLILFYIICLTAGVISAQENLFGKVYSENKEPLFGATVQWQNTIIGTVADEQGEFIIPKQKKTTNLEIHYVGYSTIIIEVDPGQDTLLLEVGGITDLMEIEVAAKVRDNFVSTLNPVNLETINAGELTKAACCNLSESFQTNAAIDVSYTDALTGAKEIKMLGLRGLYTQMTIEKRPALAGLGSPLAMEFIPGTWLNSIQISKGTGSVQSGFGGITGQINLELVKPFEDDPFFINVFAGSTGRLEMNVHLNKAFDEVWSSGLLLHGSTDQHSMDRNEDGFLDSPKKKTLTGLYRIFHRGENWRAQFNIHALTDDRVGGQTPPHHITVGQPIFQIFQKNQRLELFGKVGYVGFDRPNTSIGFIYNASWHDLNNRYGARSHSGNQRNFFGHLLFSTFLGTTDHTLNLGTSFSYEDYTEKLDESDFSRKERIPGVYGEYQIAREVFDGFLSRIGLLAGMRLDHHNQYGALFSPRLNLKYNFSPESIFRISAGRGYRTPNVIAENISIFASNRQIIVQQTPEIESAWNIGLNFSQNFEIGSSKNGITLDLYRTEFTNQVVLDIDQDPGKVLFYNLDGRSFSNSFLAVFSTEPVQGLEFKFAYKFNDVRITFSEDLRQKPLTAKHRGLITADYETANKRWMINANCQLIGSMRFPDNIGIPEELVMDHRGSTPVYPQLGLQVTHRVGPFEIYLGGENLTNFTQENPIIDAENPFGPWFDATQVYAPLMGITGYMGLRYRLKKS